MKDVETLYEERNKLTTKLRKLDDEINEYKAKDILNKFQVGKFYEVQFTTCGRFYYFCDSELKLDRNELRLYNVLGINTTMMFYERTLSNKAIFTVDQIVDWSVEEISKEDYFDEFNELCCNVKRYLDKIEGYSER